MRQLLLLVLLFLLSFLFLLTGGSFYQGGTKELGTGEICIQSKKCKSRCCRREPKNCESYCALKGSEGSACHTQTFLGLYNECPCLPDLTCVFPKNEKSFRIIYGRCKKTEKKKPAKKSFF
ncbi:colipase-like protein 1 [Diceros bicornis minor]|uniref:colipase-like protein 1 n=1 Tax=Diceros bicornis minor TaxID=77932 RepID=UPI0026E9D439|nr:colipase-like protein 1 [Diceros bicornis minor]